MEVLHKAVLSCDPQLAESVAREAVKLGVDPLDAIEKGLAPVIREVGKKYQAGELFLLDLIMAAEAFKAGLKVLEPELKTRNVNRKTVGTVVLGTVAGDIHCLGKDIVATLLSAAGFKVYDLGVDVPAEKFAESVKTFGANILGASALMSTTISEQLRIIEVLKIEGLRDKINMMVGGAATNEDWAKRIGADAWAASAHEAVNKAVELAVGRKNGKSED